MGLLVGMGIHGNALAQRLKVDKSITSLITTEKNFEKEVFRLGQKAAYLSVLSDNSIVFRSEPQSGKKYYQSNTKFQGLLNWDPVWVEVSKDGYFGYTTGPYRFLLNDSTLYGEYVSIWIREPFQTKWKLFVDAGASHAKPLGPLPSLSYPTTVTQSYPSIYPGIIEQSKDILLSTDVLFASLMSTRTPVQAYEEYLSPDSRMIEDGHLPIKGKDSIILNMNLHKGYLFFRPNASYVDYANDMGFTYGAGEFVDANRKSKKDRKFSYLRIWRLGLDGLWRISLELRTRKTS